MKEVVEAEKGSLERQRISSGSRAAHYKAASMTASGDVKYMVKRKLKIGLTA